MDLIFELVNKHDFLLKPFGRSHSEDYVQNLYYFFRLFSKGYYVGDVKIFIDTDHDIGRIDTIYINKMFREDWLYENTLTFLEAFFRLKGCLKIVVDSTEDIKDFLVAHDYIETKFNFLEKKIIPILVEDIDRDYLCYFLKETNMVRSLKQDENLFEDIFENHIAPEEILY